MKRWLVLLVCVIGSSAAEQASRVSFTNLTGTVYRNIIAIRTNREEIIFKQEGKLGFLTERLTNLPDRVQWEFRAQERAEAERQFQRRRNVFKSELAAFGYDKTKAHETLTALKGSKNDYSPWRDFSTHCNEQYDDMRKALARWQSERRPADEEIAALKELMADFVTVRDEAQKIYEEKFRAASAQEAKERLKRDAEREMEQQPWKDMEPDFIRRGELYDLATEAVRVRLKAPRTAVFEGSGRVLFKTKNGRTRVIGNVDSQNGFGALIRTIWVVELSGDKVLNVNFPEQE